MFPVGMCLESFPRAAETPAAHGAIWRRLAACGASGHIEVMMDLWEIWALTEGNSANGGFGVTPAVTFEEDGTFNTGEVTYSFNRQNLAIDKGGLGIRAREQE